MARVVHFEVHAGEPARAIEFYTAVFAWRFTAWGDAYWLIRTGSPDRPGIDGGLLLRRGPGPVDGQPVNAFPCTVHVDDLDAVLDKVIDSGGEVAVAKVPVSGVGWLAYVKDTEGNILGLMQDDRLAR